MKRIHFQILFPEMILFIKDDLSNRVICLSRQENIQLYQHKLVAAQLKRVPRSNLD